MDSSLQSHLGDFLDTVRTGLDHKADASVDSGPPEVHCYPGQGDLHSVVADPCGRHGLGRRHLVIVLGAAGNGSAPLSVSWQ